MPRAGWREPMDVCPGCGGPKTRRARVCRLCARMPVPSFVVHQDHVGRSIDRERQADPRWRPPHWPPICPTCRGFGFVQTTAGEHATTIEYRRKVTSRPGTDLVPGQRAVAAASRPLRDRGSRAGGWHECPDCIGHPGSATTHVAHLANRQRMEAVG